MLTLTVMAMLGAAPVDPAALLEQAKAELDRLDDAAARKTLERAQAAAGADPQLLAQVYLYLGLAWAAAADAARVIDSFHAALVLAPDLQLPEPSSPRVKQWWSKAGGRPVAPRADPSPTPAPPAAPAPAPAAAPAAVTAPPSGPAPTVVAERSHAARWVGAAAALAGLLTASAGGYVMKSSYDDGMRANADTGSVNFNQGNYNDAANRLSASRFVLGAGLVLVALGVVLFFMDP